jgi:hypothetical protein
MLISLKKARIIGVTTSSAEGVPNWLMQLVVTQPVDEKTTKWAELEDKLKHGLVDFRFPSTN